MDRDFTTVARIRNAALQLFGEHGVEGASLRAIAELAGVSAPLVVHHFGSKEGVREAVDGFVLAQFEQALGAVPADLPADRIINEAGQAFARVIVGDETLRAYTRRALMDGSAIGQRLFARLIDLVQTGLSRLSELGSLRDDAHAVWLPYQVLFVVLGPLLLEKVMIPLEPELFSSINWSERSEANLRMLRHGVFAER